MGKKISTDNFRKDRYYPRIVSVVRDILLIRDTVTAIDVFVGLELLSRESVKGWRDGRVPYLEKVILCNLAKASRILRILRMHAHDLNLEPKLSSYSGKKGKLRFSKTDDKNLEDAYRRHYYIVGRPENFRNKHGLLHPAVPTGHLQEKIPCQKK